MTGDLREEPTLRISADGMIESANQPAIDMLGLGLEELRALPPGSLAAEPTDAEEQAALREQWEAAGSAAIAGLTTIKRVDGVLIRVAFAIAQQHEGSFIATLNPVPGSRSAPTRVYTVGDVLGRWRAAERELETLAVESQEYASIREEVENLRAQYQRLFDARQRAS
jgi:PAS domain-containing protein